MVWGLGGMGRKCRKWEDGWMGGEREREGDEETGSERD